MSMIKCPECGKEISEKAKSCPNCGHPHPKKQGNYRIFNILLLIFGVLMAFAVLRSAGGIQQNINAAIISRCLILGSISFLIAFKKINKALILLSSLFYALSFMVALHSLQIAPAYLILEAAIGLVLINNIAFAKKNGMI